MSATIGLVGLGRTGLPIAQNLIARGHTVVGYRRSDAGDFTRIGGALATSPREVAERAQIILSLLPSPQALDDAMTGDRGVLAAVTPEHVVAELGSHPLIDKERVRTLFAARGVQFIDGEVSGTPAMTAARVSVILLSGDPDACERIAPLARDACDHVRYCGPFGAATKLKLVANLLVTVHTAAAAEAVLLVERAGLDPALALDVLRLGAGASTMLAARAPSMIARRFTNPAPGPVAMLAHYLEPIRALAAESGAPLPLFTAAAALLDRATAAGRADEDIACVIDLLAASHPAPKDAKGSP